MQLCLNEDYCKTGLLGVSIRISFVFLQPFFLFLFLCILPACHVKRTCCYLIPIFSFLYLYFLALLNPFGGIFDSILDFSAFY